MTTDSKGQPLTIGAMYCCFIEDRDDQLVRYVGGGRFVDADTLEDCSPDFDNLVLQATPILPRKVLLDLGVPEEAIA